MKVQIFFISQDVSSFTVKSISYTWICVRKYQPFVFTPWQLSFFAFSELKLLYLFLMLSVRRDEVWVAGQSAYLRHSTKTSLKKYQGFLPTLLITFVHLLNVFNYIQSFRDCISKKSRFLSSKLIASVLGSGVGGETQITFSYKWDLKASFFPPWSESDVAPRLSSTVLWMRPQCPKNQTLNKHSRMKTRN